MKSGILHYSWSEIKGNNKTRMLDFLSYTFFVFLAITVGLLGNSFYRSYNSHIEEEYGTYDFCIINAADEDDMSFPDFTEKGFCRLNSFIRSENGEYFSIGYLDDVAFGQLSVGLIRGRMPQNDSEIVLEEAVYYLFEDEIKNESISLSVYDFDGTESIKTYKVVGVIKNYVYNTPKIASGEAGMPYNIFPGLLVYPDSEEYSVQHILISFDSAKDVHESVFPADKNNYLINQKKYDNDTSFLYIALTVLFSTLIVLGIISLYCNIIIHKKKNLELFYKLKCAGASNRDCIRFKLTISALILLLASVTGVLSGYIASALIIRYLRNTFIDYLSFENSGWLVLITLAVTTLTVMGLTFLFDYLAGKKRPLELNIDQKNASDTLKIKQSDFEKRPIAFLSVKDVYFNSGKYVSIIISIFFLLITIVTSQVIVYGITENFEREIKHDYLVETYNGATVTSFKIPLTDYSIRQRDVDRISGLDEVDSCIAYSQNTMFIIGDKTKEAPPEYVLDNHKKIYSYSEESLERLKKEYIECGYSGTEELYSTTLYGVNRPYMDKLTGRDNKDYYNEKNVILVTEHDSGYYTAGDTIIFSTPRIDGNGNFYRVDIELEVGCILTIDERSPFYGICHGSNYFYCVAQEVIDEKIGSGYSCIYIDLKNQNNYTDTETIISQLDVIHNNEDQYYSASNREMNEEKRNVMMLTEMIGAVVTGAVCVYSLVTLIAIFRNDLYNRKKIWGCLRIAGMTRRQGTKIRCTIALLINISAIILAAAMVFVFLLVFDPDDREYVFMAVSPLVFIASCVVSVSVSQIICCRMMKKFWENSIIGMLE